MNCESSRESPGFSRGEDVKEKVLATGPRMIYVLPEPARTCWRLTRTLPYSPACNRRNPVVPEVDAAELSS